MSWQVMNQPTPAGLLPGRRAIGVLDPDTATCIGVIYGQDVDPETEQSRWHVSVTKTVNGRVAAVKSADLDLVLAALRDRGEDWREPLEGRLFKGGPFMGQGIHYWESPK